MKSQINLLVVVSASILIGIGIGGFSIVYQSQTILRDLKERSIVETVNQLEFVKKALHHSAIFSVYQSAYEVSKNGLYSTACTPAIPKHLPYWRYVNACVPAEYKDWLEFHNSLSKKVQTIFAEYLVGIKKTFIKTKFGIPDYETPQIKISEDKATEIFIKSKDRIKFSRNELEITDNGNVKEKVFIELGKILRIGQETFVKRDIIREMIVLSDNSMAGECKIQTVQECGFPPPPPTLPLYCMNEFKTRLRSLIEGLQTDNLKLKIEKIDSSYAAVLIGSTTGGECACVASGPFEVPSKRIYLSDRIALQEGIPSEEAPVEEVPLDGEEYICTPIFWQIDTYRFDYFAEVDVQVNIFSDEKYPVYDENEKKTDLRKLQLNFYVFSKN